MHLMSMLAFHLLLCLQFVVAKLCDENGATNKTIQVPCKKNVSITQVQYKTVRFDPSCGFFATIFSLFHNRCDTRYRRESYTETLQKEVPSQCDSTVCCTGYVMSNETCVVGCPNGTYGENCNLNCTCPKQAYPQCDKDTGSCTCLPGHMGINCSEPCLHGYYGDDCRYSCVCHGNASCNMVTGDCNCTEPGWTGIYCDVECNGTFGLNCSEPCACNENQTCDTVNGNCTCKPGRNGSNCSNECEEWTYGVDCQFNCSCETNTTEFCDKERGSCECLPGFVGQNCSDFCPMGFYGTGCIEKCSCHGTPYCDHINGTCICLGKHGENCSKDCDDGLYGPDCTRTCNCSNENYNKTCHPYNGTCFCKPGWTGDTCSVKETNKEYSGAQAEKSPKAESFLTSDLMIAIIAGCCGILFIIVVTVSVCVLRRRRQRCLARMNVKEYNNAAYSDTIASEALVINELEKHQNDTDKSDEVMLKEEGGDSTTTDQRDDMESPTQRVNNSNKQEDRNAKPDRQADNNKVSKAIRPDSTDKLLEAKQQVLQDMHITQEVNVGKSENQCEGTDEDSDHYSDIDSVKDEKEERDKSVDDLIPDQGIPDEEQYDSLENDTVKKVDVLPNYSSFEEVRKETIEESQEKSDDPYDKLFLANQNKKKTLTRNDYHTFKLTDKTAKECVNKDSQGSLDNFTKERKSSISDVSTTMKTQPQTQALENDDSEYNSLDHTGKSFKVLNKPQAVYHTGEIFKQNINATNSNSGLDSKVKLDDPSEAQQEKDNNLIEEPEYNTLDHTGKSFRAAEVPFNIYDTNKMESASNNPKRKLSRVKRQASIEEELSEKQNPDSNNSDAADDSESEYNSLDHTGKSFRKVNIPDDIYHNKTDRTRKDSNRSATPIDIDISHNIGEEEEDSYSFCEIDDVENEPGEKSVTDDDAFIYENPEISDDESDSHGTSKEDEKPVSKAKVKSNQRRIDDYEHYDLTFG